MNKYRVCLIIIVLVGIGTLVLGFSSRNLIPVIDAPIQNEAIRDRIIMRINQEGVNIKVSSTGVIHVKNEQVARRMRNILIREDLIPPDTDPWAIFNMKRWTITEFDRNMNHRIAITQMLIDHIKAMDDIKDANVDIIRPTEGFGLIPVSANVIINPMPESDIAQNRNKIEGIEKLLGYAVEELKTENIIIVNNTGFILNDFYRE